MTLNMIIPLENYLFEAEMRTFVSRNFSAFKNPNRNFHRIPVIHVRK